MSLITGAQLRPIDPINVNLLLGALANAGGFISRLVPQINVGGTGATGKIFKVPTSTFMGPTPGVSLRLSKGAEAQPITIGGPTTVDYAVLDRAGIAGPIHDNDIDDNLSPIDLEAYHSEALGAAFSVDEEIALSSLLFGSGTGWATTVNVADVTAGGGVKLDAPGSHAIDLVESLIESFRAQCYGNLPLDCVMGWSLARAFRKHDEIRAISSGGKFSDSQVVGYVSAPKLVEIFKTEFNLNLYIGGARKRNSNPGQSYSDTDIHPDAMWLGILQGVGTAMGGMNAKVTPCAIAIIRRKDIEMKPVREETKFQTHILGKMRSIEKVLDVNMGVLALDGVT